MPFSTIFGKRTHLKATFKNKSKQNLIYQSNEQFLTDERESFQIFHQRCYTSGGQIGSVPCDDRSYLVLVVADAVFTIKIIVVVERVYICEKYKTVP